MKISIWIQSEDSKVSDLLVEEGIFISTDDQARREQIVHQMTQVADTLRKRWISTPSVTVSRMRSNYVFEFDTQKRDEHNRTLPVMILFKGWKPLKSEHLLDERLYQSLELCGIQETYQQILEVIDKIRAAEASRRKRALLIIFILSAVVIAMMLLFLKE